MQPVNPAEVPVSTAKLSEGQQVGGCFTLKRELFQSRGIRVWLAQDEVLGKEVTLHLVPDAVAQDARAISELRQEVKRNRQLIHPNILRVYDLVEDAGTVAIAMDRFDGEPLSELLKRKGALESEQIKPWIQQIGETLSDAHRIQLFHRDLSPANFIARPNGTVLLTNFGLSRVITEALERAGQLPKDGAHLAYLSPQQIDGERLGASDDVYALGVLAYELLTGKLPFAGENMVAAIRKNPPAGVNESRSQAGRSAVSAGWEKFIAACLAKSADARPKSCAESLAALEGAKAAESGAPESKTASESVAPKPKAEPEMKIVPPPVPVPAPEPAKTTLASTSPSKSAPQTSQVPPSPPSSPAKQKPVPTLSANYPDLDRPKSKLPLIGLGVAASVLAAALYFKNETPSNTGVGGAVSRVEDSGAETGVDPGSRQPGSEIDTVTPPTPAHGAAPVAANSTTVTPAVAGEDASPVPEIVPTSASEQPEQNLVVAQSASAKPEGRGLIGANPKEAAKAPASATAAKPATAPAAPAADAASTTAAAPAPGEAKKTPGIQVIALPPAPQPLPKLTLPQNADPEALAKLLAERQAALAKYAEAASTAERVHTANAQLREIRGEDLEDQKKALEEKRKTLAPVLKAAAEFDAEKKRVEENMAKTEAAAKEAMRAAEAAKKAYEELLSTSSDMMASKEKAEAELSSVTQAVAEGTKAVEELSEGATKAEAQRQQMLQAKKQAEQEIAQLNTAIEKATKAKRDAMVKANKPKINALEQQIKEVDEQIERYEKAVASLEALKDDSTQDAIKRIQEKINAANAEKAGYQDEIKRLSGLAPAATAPAPAEAPEVKSPKPTGAAAKPVEATPAPAPLPEAAPAVVATAKPEMKKENAVAPEAAPNPSAEAAKGGSNSLGMKFVHVGDVDFSVHLVTRKDFETFSKSTNLKPEHWRNPGFEQTPDHPVVNVTWKEADAFCKWLTDKERKSGQLKPNEYYRLPTDLEWSKAVGLPAESGATPEDRDMRIEDVYPWGTQWPPPAGAGNFAGEETVTELPIEGYNDKFPNTSPVGSFKANAVGLYDMGGNVWQWVQDSFDGSSAAKTLRGGSWYNGAIKMSLLSSCRIKSSPETINDTYGFRVVKASDGKGKR